MKFKYVKEFDFPSDKGFSGSAGKQMVSGYARGGKAKGTAKIGKVMREFGKGELHSGSKEGPVVKSPKQAIAIALSEARKSGAKIPAKKAEGGPVASKGPRSAYPKAETPEQKKSRERRAQDLMEKAEKHAEELAKGPGYKKGGKIVEKGTGEVYASKAAMKRHEARESKAEEAAEHGKRGGGRMESRDVVSRETQAGPRSMMQKRATERMRRYEGQRPNMTPMIMKKGGYAEGGKHSDVAMDKKVIKSAVHKHEKAMHPGKPLTKLRKGGMAC